MQMQQIMYTPTQYYYPYSTYNTYNAFNPMNTMMTYATKGEVQQRTRFTKAEDELLKQLVESQNQPNWNDIASHLKNRTSRQCRERYNNYLRPNLVNGPWTKEEDDLLLDLYEKYGPRWSFIARSFNSRSPVNIKNHHSSLVSQSATKIHKTIKESHPNTPCEIKNTEVSFNQVQEPELVPEYQMKIEENDFNSTEVDPEEPKEDNFDDIFSNFDACGDGLWSNSEVSSPENDLLAF